MGLSRTMAKASSFDDLQMLVSLEDPWIVLILNMSTGHVDKKLNFSERMSKYLMQHIFYLTIKSYIVNTFLDVMIIMTLRRKSWHFILWPVMQSSLASQYSWSVLNIKSLRSQQHFICIKQLSYAVKCWIMQSASVSGLHLISLNTVGSLH